MIMITTHRICRSLRPLYLSLRGYSEGSSNSGNDDAKIPDINESNTQKTSPEEIIHKKEIAKNALFSLLSDAAKAPLAPAKKIPIKILKEDSDTEESSSSSDSESESESDKVESKKIVEGISEETKDAAINVAKSYGGDVKQTQKDLLLSFKSHTNEQSKVSIEDINAIFANIKVDNSKDEYLEKKRTINDNDENLYRRRKLSVDHPINNEYPIKRSREWHQRRQLRIDVFAGEPLNIFSEEVVKLPSKSLLPIWDDAEVREKESVFTSYPVNGFEEKIQWLNEGKLWSFPVDNETGLLEEKKFKFHDHIFLEKHIASWCPKTGPLRQFMEIVLTGLSKNPYINVERKMAHITWYREYFIQKEEILKVTGVIEKPLKPRPQELE